MKKLRVLIYRPKPDKRTIRMQWLMCSEPLEMEYLYTVLSNHDLVLIDGLIDNTDPVKKAVRIKADIILLTSFITTVNSVHTIAKQCKQKLPQVKIFVGGPHAEVVPQHFYTKYIDGVFFNNQLEGISDVLKNIVSGKSYDNIQGATFLTNGKFKRNPDTPTTPNNIPIPNRILLKKYPNKYNYVYFKNCASIKTALGCPGTCTYCFCKQMNNGNYTTRPIESVVDEIESISVSNIFILDDNFLCNTKRLEQFHDEIQKRKIHKNYIAYGTSHFIASHPELIKKLRKIGLKTLIVGFEFVEDAELSSYNKHTSILDNEKSNQLCEEYDIALFALFMVDPKWTHAQFRKLARYVIRHRICFATFSTLTNFPGTELFDHEKRVDIAHHDWWRYDLLHLHSNPRHMSKTSYYIWLFYLYLLPAMQFSTFKKLLHYCGISYTIRLIGISFLSGFEFILKLLLWR